MLRRFASNAGANLFSGAVAAGYQLAVAGLAVRAWHGAEFASWALALSVAAIAPIFAANLSSVVTRRLIELRHADPRAEAQATVLGGQRIARRLTSLAFAVLIATGAWIESRSSAGALTTSGFLILLAVALTANCWLVLCQTRFGQYYADELNWMPAVTMTSARAGGVAGMSIVLAAGVQDLVHVALGLCVGTWTGLGLAVLLLPEPSAGRSRGVAPSGAAVRVQYLISLRLLSGFAVGSASMLFVQYGIPPWVALIAPEQFNAFYLASTLNTVAVGVLAAATSAMLAPFTRWHSSSESRSLQRIFRFGPLLCVASCLAVLWICWLVLEPVLTNIAARAARIEDIRVFLALLGFQTIIRSAAAGYALYIASAGSSRQMASPLLIEIVLALCLAAPLGWLYGDRALLYALSFAGLVGSLYSSKIVASLQGPDGVSIGRAFRRLFGAQVGACAMWWWIVRSYL
jgi:hypothetical protein